MTLEAEVILKDESQRSSTTNSLFKIPDNVNDLIPNWDYKE